MEKKIKKCKIIFSLMKEKVWLEEMAQKGYLFENIEMGIIYTFRIGEPKKMIYEIDRFDLPKNPSLNEIQEKELFMSLAEEMGWQQITHDEDMNYYFSKEYVEDDINELYTDEEMRRIHAQKYRDRYENMGSTSNTVGLVLSLLLIAEYLLLSQSVALLWIVLFTVIFFGFWGYVIKWAGQMYYNELRMEAAEWKRLHMQNSNVHKHFGIFLRTKSLERYLNKQSRLGYHIVKMTDTLYFFEKGDSTDYKYCVDTKTSVNYRRRLNKEQSIKDNKDIISINHDWQIQSVKDAQEKGMQFVCSCGNGQILYRGQAEVTLEARNRLLHPVAFATALFLVGGFIAGFCVGFLLAMLA